MTPGNQLNVEDVEVVLWDRAPLSMSGGLFDPWWVIRVGPENRQELWLIGRKARRGKWTFAGRFTWQGFTRVS